MNQPVYPDGYHAIIPILRVRSAADALQFFTDAFDVVEDFRREADGQLLLAVVKVGDSRFMIFDQANTPDQIAGGDPRGNGLILKLYVADVDRVFRAAVAAGATETAPVADTYFGERSGMLTDPFGFTWQIAEFREEVPHAIIEQRMHEALKR